MSELLTLFVVGWGTALATGLGVLPVFALGDAADRLRPALTGMAAGLMAVASVLGLLVPALQDGAATTVAAGLLVGVAFLLITRLALARRQGSGPAGAQLLQRRSALVVLVLFTHSIPEGMAIGTAYASSRQGLGLFVILAVALQNIPEGTATAIPMAAAGYSRSAQIIAAVGTSAPQPFAAVAAFVLVDRVTGLLPFSFAFAAGAMLSLVAVDLVPDAFSRDTWRPAAIGALLGGAAMVALSVALAV